VNIARITRQQATVTAGRVSYLTRTMGVHALAFEMPDP
jgi:hypothetical protein